MHSCCKAGKKICNCCVETGIVGYSVLTYGEILPTEKKTFDLEVEKGNDSRLRTDRPRHCKHCGYNDPS